MLCKYITPEFAAALVLGALVGVVGLVLWLALHT